MLIGAKYPLGASLFLIFSLVFTANLANPTVLINGLTGLDRGTTIGGEVTEIVSASPLQSISVASAVEINDNVADIDLESAPYDDRDPLITGQDSLLPNQNPITIPTPEPKPVAPIAPAYTAGPYLDGYFIFPTIGYNRGKLHYYNAVDISRGDDCLYEDIPVFAAASGLATANWAKSLNRYDNGGRGNNISILHSNGIGSDYYHLKNILVKTGDYVNQSSVIAYMGGYPGVYGSGNSTGCHLHFGVRNAAQPFAR